MASSSGRILLAVDGEPHTEAAVSWALDLALGLGMSLNPVHVRDPYLKQFYTEIYAQGREEYLAHVQHCLEEKARTTRARFEDAVRRRLTEEGAQRELDWSFDVLDGEPAQQLAKRIAAGDYAMVVVGRRRRKRVAALRSRDLAERLSHIGFDVPVLVVPEHDRPE